MGRARNVLGTVLAGALALTMPGVASAAAPAVGQVARGVVYEDLDGSPGRDDAEPGVEGVLVSNGLDVVVTDDEGRYELPVDDETVLFVTKPAGYMVPVDADQLPQHFYRHYPNGSPLTTEFPGVAPTGPLPASVDFPLVAQEESDEFDVVVFADPQATDDAQLDHVRDDVVAELVGVDAAFGITVGDIVNDDLSLYPRHNDIVAEIGLPWWNLPGNHDINFDVPDDTYSTETYKRVFGPTYYSFDHGQVHFVMLDNVDYFGPSEGDYRGLVPQEQLDWLRNDLAQVPDDKLVVVSSHIPLRTYAEGGDSINTVNLPELFDVLADREHVYSMSGHDTSNSWQLYLGADEGWDGAEPFHHQVLAEVRGDGWNGPLDSRGIPAADMADGNPNGYYIHSFDGNEYSTRFRAASLPAEFQARISLDPPAAQDGLLDPADLATAQVVANVFDGGERHTVELAVDGGEFAPMTQTLRTDPYTEALAAQYADTDQASATPVASSHIWTGPVPADLDPGAHTLTVRSTDPYGVVDETSRVVEVTG